MLRYAITDGSWSLGDEAALIHRAAYLAANAVNVLQLREKHLEAGKLAALGREFLAILRGHHPACKFLINSRADVAIAIGADGVHLTSGPGSLTASQVRTLYADAGLPAPVVSVSCHSLAEVARVRDEGATYILFGPVFEKVVESERVAGGTGLELLRSACETAAPTPVLALGGVTSQNIPDCLGAGAAGVAGIRLFRD